MPLKIGVTGTRKGATDSQLLKVITYMQSLGHGHELHHGDCVGVDAEVAATAKQLGWKIICHPPEDSSLRAFFGGDETRPPATYFARNRNIVDETELLLVVPKENTHNSRGGTWYTHDYAMKTNKPVQIFYRD